MINKSFVNVYKIFQEKEKITEEEKFMESFLQTAYTLRIEEKPENPEDGAYQVHVMKEIG